MRKSSGFTLRRSRKASSPAAPDAREAFEAPEPTRPALPSKEELNNQLQKRLTQELKGQIVDAEAKVRWFFCFSFPFC